MVAKKPEKPVVADEKPVTDDTWKKKPNAIITRVFRQVDWYKKPSVKKLGVANLKARQVNGTDMPALSVILKPNHALQYVLEETQDGYAECLKGLRIHEKRGFIEEIDPAERGKIGIPPYEPTEIEKANAKLEAENAELKAKLEALKNDSGTKEDKKNG